MQRELIDRIVRFQLYCWGVIFGLILMAVPAMDFWEHRQSLGPRELTQEQRRDYERLVSTPEDPAVVKAASELLKRDDVGRVFVSRGTVPRTELEMNLQKPDVYFSTAPFLEISGYTVGVSYIAPPPSPFWSAAGLHPMHEMLSFTAGLVLIFIIGSIFFEKRLPAEPGENYAIIAPTPVPPRGTPDPLPPEPSPNRDGSPDPGTKSSGGLRLIK